jgi:hypothetical protein
MCGKQAGWPGTDDDRRVVEDFVARGGRFERHGLKGNCSAGRLLQGAGFIFDLDGGGVNVFESLFVADIQRLAENSKALERRFRDTEGAGTEVGNAVVGLTNGDADIGDFQHGCPYLERSWLSREVIVGMGGGQMNGGRERNRSVTA